MLRILEVQIVTVLKKLSDHINYHYIADKKLYSCKDCLYRTAQEKYMKVHQLAHSATLKLCGKVVKKFMRMSLQMYRQKIDNINLLS